MADFETTTDIEDCRVWAYAVCEVGNESNIKVGNSLDEFMEWVLNLQDEKVWFHNLKFDSDPITIWLFEHGWRYKEKRKELEDRQFSTLISDMGQYYSMTLMYNGSKITILDSMKVLPMSVENIAKSFGLNQSKLEINYNEYRAPGHILTEQETEYVKADVQIVAQALHIQHMHGLTRMTQGSNALHDYKKKVGGYKRFDKLFPQIEYAYDHDIRQAYRGGYVYVNPKYQDKPIDGGLVFDVNSLYPDRMRNCLLPYGQPVKYEGKYIEDRVHPLYVQCIRCDISVKKCHLPSIMIKNMRYGSNEYIEDTEGEEVVIYLTSTDLKLMYEQYDVHSIEYLGGYKFKGAHGLFDEYIEFWMKQKAEATKTGNKGLRQLSKLMLNALYGKFGLNPDVRSKHPYLEDRKVKFYVGAKEQRKPIYIPMAVFITAEARYKTITSAQRLYDRFVYADTDSLHLQGTELPNTLEIDDTRLGAWAHEATFEKGKFIRQKTYIETINGEDHITCAGMPKRCYQHVTFDNFKTGSSYGGKLLPKHVNGGIVLIEKEFTIR